MDSQRNSQPGSPHSTTHNPYATSVLATPNATSNSTSRRGSMGASMSEDGGSPKMLLRSRRSSPFVGPTTRTTPPLPLDNQLELPPSVANTTVSLNRNDIIGSRFAQQQPPQRQVLPQLIPYGTGTHVFMEAISHIDGVTPHPNPILDYCSDVRSDQPAVSVSTNEHVTFFVTMFPQELKKEQINCLLSFLVHTVCDLPFVLWSHIDFESKGEKQVTYKFCVTMSVSKAETIHIISTLHHAVVFDHDVIYVATTTAAKVAMKEALHSFVESAKDAAGHVCTKCERISCMSAKKRQHCSGKGGCWTCYNNMRSKLQSLPSSPLVFELASVKRQALKSSLQGSAVAPPKPQQ